MPKKQQSQPDRFREAARELECDESEERFDGAMKRLAKANVNDLDSGGNEQATPAKKKPARPSPTSSASEE